MCRIRAPWKEPRTVDMENRPTACGLEKSRPPRPVLVNLNNCLRSCRLWAARCTDGCYADISSIAGEGAGQSSLSVCRSRFYVHAPSASVAKPARESGDANPATDPTAVEYFEKNVRPILANRCQGCHGPAKQKGGLRLDAARRSSLEDRLVQPSCRATPRRACWSTPSTTAKHSRCLPNRNSPTPRSPH